MPPAPFSISIPDQTLVDLRERIRRTRWPDQLPGIGWTQGTEREFLQALLADWAAFDWRARERELNRFRHFRAEIDGVRIHFVHERARSGAGIPLVLTHGWPSCFVEYLGLVPLLDGFDLVIPSLPGYGFSERPAQVGVNYRYTAGLWRKLMRELGYDRYGVSGGDFGSGVATWMALDEPERVIGVHLTNLDIAPLVRRPLSEAEQAYLAQNQRWADVERGYSSIQSTKPQTVGYGLNDSPAGLAAWILEKWRSWTDSGGEVGARVSREFLLTLLTIYWATQSITSSMRDYFDNRFHGSPLREDDFVRAPTAIAVFAHELVPEGEPPREWAERLYDVRRWTRMPRGGHFAPAEEPELVAQDIAAFFGAL